MSTTKETPLILVDGSSYLFRAYHALPPLTNAKGMPTGAIYGVINMLRRLLKDYSPTHMAVVFDPKGPTFRHELYPTYKANRQVMPNDLQIQIPILFQAIEALGIPLIIVPNVEADDVIATLTHAAENEKLYTLVSTSDKDLAQIVNDQTSLINTMSNTKLDIPGVKQKFGVWPHQIIDYLTLVGDSVDNIPGIPNVGPKTAAKWLEQYQNLDNIIINAEKIAGKVGENLRNYLSELPLVRQLVKVQNNIPLSVKPSDLVLKDPNKSSLEVIFIELEFKNWLGELKTETERQLEQKDKIKSHYETLLDFSAFQHWLANLTAASSFSLQIVTSQNNTTNAKLTGFSLATEKGKAAYLPFEHNFLGAPIQLEKTQCTELMKAILNDPNKTLIGHNLKLLLQVLRKENLSIENKCWDNMLAAYLINSADSRFDLNALALKYLKTVSTNYEDIAGKGIKQLSFNQVPLEEACCYAAELAELSLQLYPILKTKIEENNLTQVLYEIELPLMPILAKIESHGVLIDIEMLAEQSEALQYKIDTIEQQVFDIAGERFNLGSPKQLQTILFEKLQLPGLKKTPTGQPSTAENVLQELAKDHEIARLILDFRTYCKLKTTYTDKLPEQVNIHTGRIHTNYQQTGTVTGRLSSKDPNLQNIPARSEEGRKIRQAFIAPPNYKIMSADYSQVELRLMAHLSQDKGLITAFAQELDIHSATAAEVFGVKLEAVTANQRRDAKAINFGLIYGMSSFGLSEQLNISRQQAQEYIDLYFSRYPKVYEYMEKSRITAKQGFVTTLFGRRVYLPDIHSPNQQRRIAAERAAINAPLQGSAADIIKLAMISLENCFVKNKIKAHIIMQVHDELIFEVAEDDVEISKQKIHDCMENVIPLTVPLLVDIGVGNNWDEAH